MLVERVKSAAEDEGRNMEEEPRALSPAEQEYWTHFSWWADRVSTHVSTPTYLKGIISAINRQNYTFTVDSLRVRSRTYSI